MPTYDYICDKCQKTFEFFQSMSDDPVKNCPECKNDIRRLVSGGTGLIFKGSGFYLTDYKKAREKTDLNDDKNNSKKDKKDSTKKSKKTKEKI